MKSAWFFCIICSWCAMTEATSKLFGCLVTYSTKDCGMGDPPMSNIEMTQKSLQYVDSTEGFQPSACTSSSTTKTLFKAPTVGCITFGFTGSTGNFELGFKLIDNDMCASPENLNCAYEEQMSKSQGMYEFRKEMDGIPAKCSIKSDDPVNPFLNVWKCTNSHSKTFYILKIAFERNDKIYSGTHFNVLLTLALLSTVFILILMATIFFSWRRR